MIGAAITPVCNREAPGALETYQNEDGRIMPTAPSCMVTHCEDSSPQHTCL